MMALCMEMPIGFKMAKQVIHLLHQASLVTMLSLHTTAPRSSFKQFGHKGRRELKIIEAMAGWNVTLCPSASSLLKMSSKNRIEQVLGMVPSPQLSPRTIRGGEQYLDQLGCGGGGSPKRAYYAAFAEQMGDEEVMVEEEVMGAGVVLKKRRLSLEQVRYLESSFESENKLEPERKAQIAQKLGLQPRQVAVWFQNRRARSKSKQLERDFNALKAEYHAVLLENEKLQAEVDRLTAQLREGSTPPEGGHTTVAKEMKELKTSASNVCSSNCGSVGVKVEAEAEAGAEAEASTASGEIVRGNELGDGEEQSSPCTMLVEENMNVSTSVFPFHTASAAAMRARVAETTNYEALMGEDIHMFTNCMHQVYAHQLVDLYTVDTLHYDSNLFIALDDPWSD